MENLYNIAQKAMTKGKGILASDESPASADKNLQKAGVKPTPEKRQALRDLFINTPNLEKYITGIILHDETFWQSDLEGKPFLETLIEKDIIPIIKVDTGTTYLPEFPGEKITLGLDNLEERLEKYYQAGARMAKWRSVIRIDEERDLPTDVNIEANAVGLAQYALFCQKAGIVPMIEPEVLINGKHPIKKAQEVTEKTLKVVFNVLEKYQVDLKGVILKTSMVVSGQDSGEEIAPDEVAKRTVKVLKDSVPNDVPGVVFLSGGQEPDEATSNLREIAKKEPLPWEIAFSFLRAIEGPPAIVWGGKSDNVEAARDEFIKRLEANVAADQGK